MNNLPRQKLCEIIRRHGREIIDAPRRCEGLMRDNFPAHRREIAVLSAALEERIPADLLNSGKSLMPRAALLARLAARLHEDVAMEASAARWTVHTWALALGVITPDELDSLEDAQEQTDGKAHEQANKHANAQTGKPSTHVSPPASPSGSSTPPVRTSFVVALDGSGDFPTLTEAVRRAPAGSRLLVRPGIYNGGLWIDKPVEIVGDGEREQIVVRATTSSCLVMQADAATIRNLTLRGQARAGGANNDGFFAIDISHGRPLFDGCDISSDSLACVAIHNPSAAPVIRNCHIHHGVDSGVFAFDGAQGVIEACEIALNSNIGIAITGSASTSVHGCLIHDGADAGVVVWNRATSDIEGCDIYANRRANVGVSDKSVV
ncbi:MAG TPA: pectinesterase family protein, partial [Pyrinomonadaceae bacterium]|nr:pectinesterase family protein [Pyrinomonadaceae bacterium]